MAAVLLAKISPQIPTAQASDMPACTSINPPQLVSHVASRRAMRFSVKCGCSAVCLIAIKRGWRGFTAFATPCSAAPGKAVFRSSGSSECAREKATLVAPSSAISFWHGSFGTASLLRWNHWARMPAQASRADSCSYKQPQKIAGASESCALRKRRERRQISLKDRRVLDDMDCMRPHGF